MTRGLVFRYLLDGAIALNALNVLAVLAFGGVDLGIVRATTAAKPLLLLALLLPVRVAVGGSSPLAAAGAAVAARLRAAAAAQRVPPAVRDAAVAFVATRSAALAVAFIANVLLLRERAKPVTFLLPWQRLAETLTIFDAAWYVDIARRGYFFDPGTQSSVAFFPLYPLLIRVVATLFGGSETALWAAAVAISWAAFFAALVALHRLTERITESRDIARRAVLLLAVFPFSFYFGQVYSEALFLLWTVLAVSAAHRSRWLAAGLYGMLAAATRSNGVLVALPLLMMAAADRPALRVLVRRVAALAPIPLALAAYSGYVYVLTGNPLAWLDAQAQWQFSVGHAPYTHLLRTLQFIEAEGLYGWLARAEGAPIDFAYTVVALMFLAAVPFVARRFGAPLAAYVLAGLLLPLSGNVLVGFGRYASVLFPVFMLAATVRSTGMQHAILIASSLFYALFLILFVGWYPLH